MHIDEANITNLTGLWRKYGSRAVKEGELPLLHINTHWPHRCWPDWSAEAVSNLLLRGPNDVAWLEHYSTNIPESAVLSVWPSTAGNDKPLLEQQWICAFEQTAMYMALDESITYPTFSPLSFQVKPVSTLDDIKRWVDIGSEAFAYSIDRSVIEGLMNDKDVQILLAYQGEQAVACALLYKTDDIIGIHQVGVKRSFRGQGIARCFMREIITACIQWQGKYVVLQASQAGQPLYESLGFSVQFTIRNYKKV